MIISPKNLHKNQNIQVKLLKKNNLTHKPSSQILEISDDDNNLFPDLDDNLIHKYSQKSKALDETTIIDGNLLVSKTSRLVTTLIVHVETSL